MVLFPWEVWVATLTVRIGEVEVDLDDELLLKVAQVLVFFFFNTLKPRVE